MVEWRLPPGTAGRLETFQTAHNRGKAGQGRFQFAVKPDGSDAPARVLVQSEASLSWKATFEPFRRELPRAYPWLDFVSVDLPSPDKQIVKAMVRDDTRDGILSGLVPDEQSRKMVIGGTDFALVLGSRMQSAISIDAMHRQVLIARVARGEANVVYGGDALAILFPAVDDMSWEDVDDARKLRGLPELRALLAEVEEAAWSEAEAGRELEPAIRDAYQAKLHEAASKLSPSLRATATGLAMGVGLGVVTGGLAVPVGAAIGLAIDGAEAAVGRLRYQRSWLAAGNRLTRLTKPTVDASLQS
jgi:hypothetical protein